jgi:uncharacterized repeat protein (TIGR01451 family)
LLAGVTYTVNANTDSGTGTGTSGDLRYCITQVNKDPVTNNDLIDFAISGSTTIALASALPAITTPVFVNGDSEGVFTGVPLITIDATKVASTGTAIEVDAGNSKIAGLSVINSPGDAITLVGNGKGGGDGDTIVGCFIGTADGTTAGANAEGIEVVGSSGNVIGGYSPTTMNVISGNSGNGITIADPTNGLPSNNNRILGNYIGVDKTGAVALANSGIGIYIDNSSGDLIDKDVVSANGLQGIRVDDSKGVCSSITITSNMVGTSADGTQGLGNDQQGILVSSAANLTIGGVGAGNVISDNGAIVDGNYTGLRLDAGGASGNPTTNTLIEGNKIGTDITGTVELPNGYDGIRLLGAIGTTIGGTAAGAGNLVSGNWVDNVSLDSLTGTPLNQNTLVEGNIIGPNAAETQSLGDVNQGRYGIYQNGANGTSIGGTTAGAGNVISGNIADGIFLGLGSNTLVAGNHIGTDASATKVVANGGNGVTLSSVSGVTITGNIIGGNTANGIGSASSGPSASNVVIQANDIGTSFGTIPAGLNLRTGISGLGFDQSGGLSPPDTVAAVGKQFIVETINATILITNKNGGVILNEPLSSFFPQSQYFLYDPAVFYDDDSGRFVVEAMENDIQTDSFGNVVPTSTSFINVAFSDIGNEDSFSTQYRISTRESNSWADFPRFGFNADVDVFTFNMFDASTGNPTNVQILSIAKSSIGQPQPKTVRVDNSADFTDTPASMHGALPGQPMYFVESSPVYNQYDPNSFRVLTWANPLVASSAFSENEITVPDYFAPAPADQKGGLPVDTNDYRALSVAWRNNLLVAANTSSVDGSGVAKAHWYEFQTNPSSPASIPLLLQSGVIDPGTGVSTYFPAIDINVEDDIGLTYMESSANEYVSMYVAGQIHGDPAGTMRPGVLAQAGVAPYVAFDGSPYREGDFAGMGVDPVNGSFWAANEYATATVEQPGANYGTWIAQFSLQSTSVTGFLELGNSGDGIHLSATNGGLISGNIISANYGNGIYADSTTSNLLIENNSIGTDPSGENLGNSENGVNLLGSSNQVSGNTSAFNGVAGVLVGGAGAKNQITSNMIHDNGGLGISLGDGFTPTPNQPNGGTLPGPNNLQNYPTLTAAIVDVPSNTTQIKGSLNEVASGPYTIQFFSNPTGDPSGHGQGLTYLGQTTVTVSNGTANFNYTLSTALTSGAHISATATSASGNTSEFSSDVQTQASVKLALTGSAHSTSQPNTYPGDTLKYTFKVSNTGDNPATQVVLTDTLDSNTQFVSAATQPSNGTSYSISGSTVTVNLGTLAAGSSATVTISVLVGVGGGGGFNLTNTASVATFDYNSAAPTQTTVTTPVHASADLAIVSITPSSGPIYPTGDLTYTIVVINNGPSNSSAAILTDTIPGLSTGTLNFVSSSPGGVVDNTTGVVRFTLSGLTSGASRTFLVTVSPTPEAVTEPPQQSTAQITGGDHDPDPGNNTLASVPITVTPAIDLVAKLVGSTSTVQVGGPLSYTATVTNTSADVDSTGVTLVDTLPANVTVLRAPAGSTIVGNTLTYTIGNLQHGQTSAPVEIVVSPTSAALVSPTITNTVEFEAAEHILDPTQAQQSVTTNVIDRPGTLAFASASYLVKETAGSATLTVTRSDGQRGTATVHYETVPINATPGMDYIPVSGILTFPSGTTSQSITVPVLENPYDNHNELVSIVLSDAAPSGASVGTPGSTTLTIEDTDPNNTLPTVSSLTWSGNSSSISALNLGFSLPLVAATANNPSNYFLLVVGAGGVSSSGIALSPSYNPSTFVVTLTPSQPLVANQFFELVVNGTSPGGIESVTGLPLAGNGTTEGTNTTALSRSCILG